MRENALLFLTIVSYLISALAVYRLLRIYRTGKPFLLEYLLAAVWIAMLIVCLAMR